MILVNIFTVAFRRQIEGKIEVAVDKSKNSELLEMTTNCIHQSRMYSVGV